MAWVVGGLPHDVSSGIASKVLPRFQPGCMAATLAIASPGCGDADGEGDGDGLGDGEGDGDGDRDGLAEGDGLGDRDGLADGEALGDRDGLTDGEGEPTFPVHVTPLSVKVLGAVLAPDHDPLKPKETVALVAMAAFQLTLTAVTCAPDEVIVLFHGWVTCCPEGNVQASLQPLIGSPRLVTPTSAVKPPGHWEVTVYATRQPTAAWALTAVITPAGSSTARAPATMLTHSRALRKSRRFKSGLLCLLSQVLSWRTEGPRCVELLSPVASGRTDERWNMGVLPSNRFGYVQQPKVEPS
ncbi:hypothetical protein Mame01_25940 [Microbispora amethystogenes]|nr:hypothetical protein Mame01_25940 [Microbispora amethystogenes]